MKVMNISILIRNDHGDTFPVALTPQMVSVIQNLLTQIPVMKSNIVDAAGKKVAAGQASIPIIPRYVDFDWDKAYSPMMPDEEAKLMKSLQEKYKEDEALRPIENEASDAAKLIVPEGMDTGKDDDSECKVTPLFTDKDNPFNMELNANGRANVDLEDEKADDTETAGAGSMEGPMGEEEIPPPLTPEEMAENARSAGEKLNEEASEALPDDEVEGGIVPAAGEGDCTVTPESLKLNGGSNPIGG